MSEEKELNQVTVTVEHDGEVDTYEGTACAVIVVDGEGKEGCSAGHVSIAEAIAMIDGLGCHIGKAASVSGISHGVAEAIAADSIRKQIAKETYQDMFSGYVSLGSILGKCVERPDSEAEES